MAQQALEEHWGPAIHDLIVASPPGQLPDVVAGCRQLAQVDIPEEIIGRACAERNERGLLAVPLASGDGATGVVCESGRLGPLGRRQVPYRAPRSGHVFVVDHEAEECVALRPREESDGVSAEPDSALAAAAEPFREAAERELQRYVRERNLSSGSAEGASGAAVHCVSPLAGASGVALSIAISSRRARPRSFWAGSWASQWRIAFSLGQAEPAEFSGVIEFRTRYAEDANVHFRRRREARGQLAETSDPERFATELAAEVARLEDEFHEGTEEDCVSFGAGPLKSLRRVLPLSKERFDWRPLRHQLVREVKEACEKDGLGT